MGRHNNWPLIINLGNSIIGVAVLAMPFCFKQCGILLGMLTLLFCCWLTLCSSSLLMRAGIISRRSSYEFLAYHTHGATGKLVAEIGMIGMQMGTLIAQIVVVGDLGPAIVSKLLGIENTDHLRTGLLIILCLGVGLPMGLLKDLRAVSRGSTVCIMFYCSFVVYILLLSIPNLWSGDWYYKVSFWSPRGLFQCLPILSFSFGCQTQLFLVYEELPEPSLKAISGITSSAVNLCAVAYLLVGFFGYITFHTVEVPGDILAVFPSTFVADIMKLCFVFSIVITFPVIIFPCRASIYTLLFAKKAKAFDDTFEGSGYIPENLFKAITVCIIISSMITGILIPNVEFILGMNGAIMGTLICYIFPALFFIKVGGNKTEGKNIAKLVLFLGVTILLVSTFATLSSQDKGHTHVENDASIAKPPPVDQQVPAWQDKHLNKQNVDAGHPLEQGINAKKKELSEENRKEPPVPNPPMSNEKESPVEKETGKKKDESIPNPKVDELTDKKIDAAIEKVKLEAKEKEMEAIHKVKENELKEKEKKQEEILQKLEEHKQEQEKILKEQIEVLKELKDHKERDTGEELEKKVEQKENVKDEIVKRQQELLNQQQKVNQQQQELIKQQQHQINQQIFKDKGVSVKPQQQPAALNQQVPKAQPAVNQVLNAQALNPQALPDAQQALNPHGLPNAQQGLPNAQQPLNPQGLPNAQQGLSNAQQELPNAQQPLNPQALPNAQQGLPNAQQPLNPQALPNAQQGLPNAQQPLNPQALPNAQQGLPNAQQPLNPQELPNAQQALPNSQQALPNAQQALNQQAPHPPQVLNAQKQDHLLKQPQPDLNVQPAGLKHADPVLDQGLNRAKLSNQG